MISAQMLAEAHLQVVVSNVKGHRRVINRCPQCRRHARHQILPSRREIVRLHRVGGNVEQLRGVLLPLQSAARQVSEIKRRAKIPRNKTQKVAHRAVDDNLQVGFAQDKPRDRVVRHVALRQRPLRPLRIDRTCAKRKRASFVSNSLFCVYIFCPSFLKGGPPSILSEKLRKKKESQKKESCGS